MDSFGKHLKDEREKKSIDLETAERDTSISRRYIEALENEQLDAFPGEAYLVGFLKNYAEYLGLESAHLISLYRAKKIQESPVPEGLLKKQIPRFVKPLTIGAAAFVMIAIITTVYVCTVKSRNRNAQLSTVLANTSSAERYVLSAQPLQKRLYKGDVLVVPSDDGDMEITVAGTQSELQLSTPAGMQMIELSEEREIDVDGMNGSEIIVYLSDISRTDALRGAEVRVILKNSPRTRTAGTDIASIPSVSEAGAKRQIVLEDTRAYPFTINSSFRGSCVFRYQTDNREEIEDYFTSGDILTIQASNGVRLWISNNNAVKFQIIADGKTINLEVGRAGQVIVQDIKWIKDTDGTYKLAVIPID
ncbi:helix-turn-helix domain-containing protein [Treponema brennaborense]|uniref:DUF4115 domain-containing protein n=1 Tax=Treponema brennaborense (strain DSM 12168 / CIP 105900 / DD5/3) TaxID=906968 RepID=F4LPF9_TREBD|nr:helix-turn-helix domain-containing protein [Treponema brennaborense]AEE15970.1 hypothetical protein Trebr_0527 [Treponema brennaborense DSM 12168]